MTIAFSGSAAARHQQQLFESVFQHASDAILILNSVSRVLRVNARAERLFGRDARELQSTLLSALLPNEHTYVRPGVSAGDFESSNPMRAGSWQSFLRRPDGSRIPVLVAASAIAEDDESLWIVIVRETPAAVAMTEKALRQVLHDPLTGLPNRDLFRDRLSRAVERARRRGDYAFAVLLLDLDRFQVINGSLGHATGDELLQAVAQRLEECARSVDTIARLGGDEFAILLDDLCDPGQAEGVADRLLNEIAVPFNIRGQQVYTSASIGIALSATGYEHESEVLRDADTAMYRAKALGKARHQVFDSAMHRQALQRLQLEAELRQALEQQQFRVYYQPIVGGASGRFVGFEALVRLEHPERGIVSPAEFIAVAEETGLIVPLGTWVIREACMRLKAWHDAGWKGLRIAVNCSARQFEQPGFEDMVDQIFRSTGVGAADVELEITEGSVMRNLASSLATLEALKSRGIRISVDDFGTGYSALGYLKALPLSSLKIDQSFIRDASSDTRTRAIVDAIVVLAHNLELNVVAEGVETPEQLDYLRSIRCDEYQGFLVSRPAPADEATELLIANCGREVPAEAIDW